MHPIRQKLIRSVLRKYPEGLTANQLERLTNVRASDVRRCLTAMPDVYVDRWVPGARGQFEKVWIAVYVPENCPHPRDRKFVYTPPKTQWARPWLNANRKQHEVHGDQTTQRDEVEALQD